MENNQNADYSWLLDVLAEHLKSDEWSSEICDFIDEHCIFFAGELEDENSLEFTKYHNDFKELIDEQLDDFCENYSIDH